ncbi:MAG: hypothetical protein WC780_05610 [Lentimicrobiaceae bacterium]
MTFQKSRTILVIGDFVILSGIIAGLSLFAGHADLVLLASWIIIVSYTLIIKRYLSAIHLVISTFIAIAWVYFAQANYGYNHEYITIAGMNILPLLAWALGLIGVSEIFNHFITKRKLLNFILFIPVFWILLILIETYAFHVIEIRDTMSGNSIGLPFCNCIHAPWWMRIVYFTLGPVYFGLTQLADSLVLSYQER